MAVSRASCVNLAGHCLLELGIVVYGKRSEEHAGMFNF